MNLASWPLVLIGHCAGKQAHDFEKSAERAAVAVQLDFDPSQYLKRVNNTDSRVLNDAFQRRPWLPVVG